MLEALILAGLGVWLFLALRACLRRGRGGCGGDCRSCCGGCGRHRGVSAGGRADAGRSAEKRNL